MSNSNLNGQDTDLATVSKTYSMDVKSLAYMLPRACMSLWPALVVVRNPGLWRVCRERCSRWIWYWLAQLWNAQRVKQGCIEIEGFLGFGYDGVYILIRLVDFAYCAGGRGRDRGEERKRKRKKKLGHSRLPSTPSLSPTPFTPPLNHAFMRFISA